MRNGCQTGEGHNRCVHHIACAKGALLARGFASRHTVALPHGVAQVLPGATSKEDFVCPV